MENSFNSAINILYLIDKSRYLTKMSRVRFHALKALETKANVIYWGPGWDNYNEKITLSENLERLKTIIHFIICYKAENILGIAEVSIFKCITYNEMYDFTATVNEINAVKPDLIICHHENDMINYQPKNLKGMNCFTTFIHIPHCADKSIYYDKKEDKKNDILLCGIIGKKHNIYERLYSILKIVTIPPFVFFRNLFNPASTINLKMVFKRHLFIIFYGYPSRIYPLRQRYREVLNLIPPQYKTLEYQHPGYIRDNADSDVYAKEFSDIINQSRICLTCTSKFKYRLAKMVEIPMCGSVLACDIPNQDKKSFKEILIEIDYKMSNKEIANKLVYYLENANELEKIRLKGYKWSQQYSQEYYANKILQELVQGSKKAVKIYVHSEDLPSIKNKWICDVLKDDFLKYSQTKLVARPEDADIIWLLAPWAHSKINKVILNEKFVITTIHHIDENKYTEKESYFTHIDNITNRYHTICSKSNTALKKITNKEIITANFWINEKNFFAIQDKRSLRKKYNIRENAFVVGSFQKDSEGKDVKTPKLSKGPDIFIKIIEDQKKTNSNIHVILTGWRRNYIMKELERIDVSYSFFESVDSNVLNELYNCLDLYIVSSRVEGGPRAILECGLAKVPIISTDVGISEFILHKESIFDMNNFMTYKMAKPNVDHAFEMATKYTINTYMEVFVDKVFHEVKAHSRLHSLIDNH